MVTDAGHVISKPMPMCQKGSLSTQSRKHLGHFQSLSPWPNVCEVGAVVWEISETDSWTVPASLADSNKKFQLEALLNEKCLKILILS